MGLPIPSVPPPQIIEQIVDPFFIVINCWDNAAMAAAPLNSAAIPSSNHSQRAASSIALSLTSTISSTYLLIRLKFRGSDRLGAKVPALVSILDKVTKLPAFLLS